MTAPDHNNRKAPTRVLRRKLAKFYGGLGCVVTGLATGVSLHHLDGNRRHTKFPNLLPLALDLHNGLKPGLTPDNLKPELRESKLKQTAMSYFKAGDPRRAYGCLRLAHALAIHFFHRAHRDLEVEFEIAAHCLYFLRRCIGGPYPVLVYANLQWLLSREVQHTLDEQRIIPPFGAISVLIELGSWLCELGQSSSGLDLLRTGLHRLNALRSQLAPSEVARFQRQLANALVEMGQYGDELESAVKMSLDCGDKTDNNKFAVFNTQVNLYLGNNQPKQALAVLKERIEYFEQQTDYFFGPLTRMEPTIGTSLGYIALSLVCESQVARTRSHRRKLEDRLEALKQQERRYGRMALLNRVPNLISLASQAAKSLPAMHRFLDGRLFPVLPQRVVDTILKIASQL